MRYRIATPKCVNLFFLLLLLLPAGTFAQDRATLEEERRRILSNLSKLNTRLQQTRTEKKNMLDDYSLLNRQLENRNELLNNLNRELAMADSLMTDLDNQVCSIDAELELLDQAYGILARNAFRLRLNKQLQAFILSSNSLNDLLKRIRYIQTYEQYRKKQAQLLIEKQQQLLQLLESQRQIREEKATFLETIRDQKVLMEGELQKQNALIAEIKKNEKQLLGEIQQKEKDRKRLDNLIENIISRAIASENTNTEPRVAPSALTFSKSKGKLNWPVDDGFVLRKFGKQSHPTLKSVQIVNNGIDIESTGSRTVVGVFQGTVVGVQFIPGFDNTIIVRHGNFYTVYSNLTEIFVERGAEVRPGMKLGNLAAQKPVLHFEIWQEKKRLNPLQWLRPETKKQY